jgi:hypothetical protein
MQITNAKRTAIQCAYKCKNYKHLTPRRSFEPTIFCSKGQDDDHYSRALLYVFYKTITKYIQSGPMTNFEVLTRVLREQRLKAESAFSEKPNLKTIRKKRLRLDSLGNAILSENKV